MAIAKLNVAEYQFSTTVKMRVSSLLMALVCLMAPTRGAAAHPVPFTYLDVRIQADGISGTLVAHTYDLAHDLQIEPPERLLDAQLTASLLTRIAELFRERLIITADGQTVELHWLTSAVLPDQQSVAITFRAQLARAPGRLTVNGKLFPYDPNHQTFLNLYEGDALTQALLNATDPEFEHFAGSRQGIQAVVARFVREGIRHILIGPDHVLFLVGLLLLGGSLRRLAVIVTAFTLAHSITLTLAALDLFRPPAQFIEPAIALSIVYVGVDNLLKRDGRDMRAWIAFAFGLIHGFGFANVLREMALPPRALGWSLFSFNLGVEIGQLLVVTLVAGALSWLRAWNERASKRLVFAGSVGVIIAGGFWFLERVFFARGIS